MSDEVRVIERGLLSLSEAAWVEARRRAAVIAPLATSESVSHRAADAAGEQLGLSRRQVYALVKRYRQGSGLVTDLVPGRSSGGRGAGRLPEPVESVIEDVVRRTYLRRQKLTVAAVHREVVRTCRAQGLRAPARNSVASRIARLSPGQVAQARGGTDAARGFRAAGGTPPPITRPLQQLQIDHTMVDVMVVDERDRQPIGRPYLTAAIDVFSRCLPGLVVTLEPPSAVSVGLCLAQVLNRTGLVGDSIVGKRGWTHAEGHDPGEADYAALQPGREGRSGADGQNAAG